MISTTRLHWLMVNACSDEPLSKQISAILSNPGNGDKIWSVQVHTNELIKRKYNYVSQFYLIGPLPFWRRATSDIPYRLPGAVRSSYVLLLAQTNGCLKLLTQEGCRRQTVSLITIYSHYMTYIVRMQSIISHCSQWKVHSKNYYSFIHLSLLTIMFNLSILGTAGACWR